MNENFIKHWNIDEEITSNLTCHKRNWGYKLTVMLIHIKNNKIVVEYIIHNRHDTRCNLNFRGIH